MKRTWINCVTRRQPPEYFFQVMFQVTLEVTNTQSRKLCGSVMHDYTRGQKVVEEWELLCSWKFFINLNFCERCCDCKFHLASRNFFLRQRFYKWGPWCIKTPACQTCQYVRQSGHHRAPQRTVLLSLPLYLLHCGLQLLQSPGTFFLMTLP